MSLTEAELEQHCGFILKRTKIKNKIVVLCEGARSERGEILSPQLYGKMEQFPDADFYSNCIPSYWTQRKPCFFNCGDRNDTINTYFKLLEIHNREPEQSNLSIDLLFALIDIDLNTAEIEDYTFSNTEIIFHDLYRDLRVNLDRLSAHRIWVTGFKHKEAYFINPALQQIFDKYPNPIIYQDVQLKLDAIYRNIVADLSADGDLHQHFDKVVKRISHCQELNCTNPSRLANSWHQEWEINKNYRNELVFGLLAVSPSKPYWEQVHPDENYSRSASEFRNELYRHIAEEFYAKQDSLSCLDYHLPCFFRYLYDLVH